MMIFVLHLKRPAFRWPLAAMMKACFVCFHMDGTIRQLIVLFVGTQGNRDRSMGVADAGFERAGRYRLCEVVF